ncbi:MAG: GTPase RsgA [Gallintestinimicrobium sp.]
MASECPEYVIAIGVPIIKTSVVNEDGLSQIYQYLKEYHTVAFVGSSGVGKSTLINHILGTDHLETGDLRNDDKGRHTTTHRELFYDTGKRNGNRYAWNEGTWNVECRGNSNRLPN